MSKYIDKSEVIAEINRVLNSYDPNEITSGRYALVSLRNFIDTLEMKGADLENSVHGTVYYPLLGCDYPNIYFNYEELKDYCDKNGIKDGDKVKVSIFKEE